LVEVPRSPRSKRELLSPATLQSAPAKQRPRLRTRKILLGFIVLLILFMLLAHPVYTHLRAAGLLLRIQDPTQPGALSRLGTYPVEERLTTVATSSGTIPARLYTPQGTDHAPGMVIVHGVHHLGIEEPRLVKFARAVSASGIKVMTPQLDSLADYRIDGQSIALIGDSARTLSSDIGQKVGVLGLSFAGGLSLLTSADTRYAPYIQFVVSVGSHDDLERVSDFLITNKIVRPDGTILEMPAHEYGPLVLIYSHVNDFFPAAEVDAAGKALRLLLWEQVDESKKAAAQLSPSSREIMELLYQHQSAKLSPEMKQVIARHQAEMAPASPHGHLSSLHIPVLLLHGAADNVIPPSELLWLQNDVPRRYLKNALISPAISHVSMEGEPSLGDKFRLVHFMAQMLDLAGHQQLFTASETP
jgi:dienelactone hydrolase